MLIIRLARRGKKNQPTYRIIILEKARDNFGKALEILGTHQPMLKTNKTVLNEERIKYWLSKGAQMSDSIKNLFIEKKIISGEKVNKFSPKKKEKEGK